MIKKGRKGLLGMNQKNYQEENSISKLTKEQRENIERFMQSRKSVITLDQAKAIVRAIIETHDMIEQIYNKMDKL